MTIFEPILCYLTCSANFWGGSEYDFLPSAILRKSCLADENHPIKLIDNPNEADIILFAESHRDDAGSGHFLEKVWRTPIYRKFAFKTVVHSGKDLPFPIIPGIYPSLHRFWAKGMLCVGGPYLVEPNPFLTQDVGWNGETSFLAGFQGACGRKQVRLQLLTLNSPQMPIIDSGEAFISAIRTNNAQQINDLKSGLVRQMLESKFCLCPCGAGTSSFRIFEAMQLGRSPVIISDNWLLPPGPKWLEFTVFVREKDLPHLPDILKTYEPNWQKMGNLARQAWEKFYSPTRIGQTVVLSAFDLLKASSVQRFSHRVLSLMQMFDFNHLRRAKRILLP